MSVSIIIPVYNAYDFAQACIQSVYSVRTTTPFEVIVVNNGSSPEVAARLGREQNKRANLFVLNFDQPLGFAQAVNVGSSRARYEFLVLLNSDTVVTDGWLDGLQEALTSDSRFGVVSPVTNRSGQEIQMDPEAKDLFSHEAQRHAARIRNRKQLIREPQRLAFFCVMIRRDVWERLGGLEEAYGVGNFEDDDFCLRARLAGFELVVARNVFVFHHERTTFRLNHIDHDRQMSRNQLLFCKRASCLARSKRAQNVSPGQLRSRTTVIVTAIAGAPTKRLCDSLTSLANQTVTGFETVVVSRTDRDVNRIVQEFDGPLKISHVQVATDSADQPARLLNAGLETATGERIAYLPTGGIYYPFHLELLEAFLDKTSCEGAYSMWSAVMRHNGQEARGVTCASELTTDHLLLGDWAPLICWIHSRKCINTSAFDESFQVFAGWEFVLRLSRCARIAYVPAVTCEHRIASDYLAPECRIKEAQQIMMAFPVSEPSLRTKRQEFLEAVRKGNWEDFLIINRETSRAVSEIETYESPPPVVTGRLRGVTYRMARGAYHLLLPLQARHKVERLSRRIRGLPPIARADQMKLQSARENLAKAIAANRSQIRRSGPIDIIQFNIISWDHLTQRPQHFARQFAAHGYRVIWIDVKLQPMERSNRKVILKELEPGILYMELPGTDRELYHLRWDSAALATMETTVDRIRVTYEIKDAIQIINFPKWAPLSYRLRERFGWPIVYDCLDDHKSFAALYQLDTADFEDQLAKDCDLLVACSRLLFEDRCRLNTNTILVPNAADYGTFSLAVPEGLLAHLRHPIVGFFGALGDWLDLDWIQEVAERFPAWSFVYIGRLVFARSATQKHWKKVTSAANIHVFPQTAQKKLAAYLAEFDVCTMPFKELPMTKIMNAVKIYEYLAAGKTVVVPDLPELGPLVESGLIKTYRDHEHSFQLLEDLTRKGPTPDEIDARRNFAAQNTWTHRIRDLISKLPTGEHSELQNIGT